MGWLRKISSPHSLKLVWDGGKIVKDTDPGAGAKIW